MSENEAKYPKCDGRMKLGRLLAGETPIAHHDVVF
jgi:hypothetical protein